MSRWPSMALPSTNWIRSTSARVAEGTQGVRNSRKANSVSGSDGVALAASECRLRGTIGSLRCRQKGSARGRWPGIHIGTISLAPCSVAPEQPTNRSTVAAAAPTRSSRAHQDTSGRQEREGVGVGSRCVKRVEIAATKRRCRRGFADGLSRQPLLVCVASISATDKRVRIMDGSASAAAFVAQSIRNESTQGTPPGPQPGSMDGRPVCLSPGALPARGGGHAGQSAAGATARLTKPAEQSVGRSGGGLQFSTIGPQSAGAPGNEFPVPSRLPSKTSRSMCPGRVARRREQHARWVALYQQIQEQQRVLARLEGTAAETARIQERLRVERLACKLRAVCERFLPEPIQPRVEPIKPLMAYTAIWDHRERLHEEGRPGSLVKSIARQLQAIEHMTRRIIDDSSLQTGLISAVPGTPIAQRQAHEGGAKRPSTGLWKADLQRLKELEKQSCTIQDHRTADACSTALRSIDNEVRKALRLHMPPAADSPALNTEAAYDAMWDHVKSLNSHRHPRSGDSRAVGLALRRIRALTAREVGRFIDSPRGFEPVVAAGASARVRSGTIAARSEGSTGQISGQGEGTRVDPVADSPGAAFGPAIPGSVIVNPAERQVEEIRGDIDFSNIDNIFEGVVARPDP